jgi:hypothetical protein
VETGVVTADFPLILDVLIHLASGVAALHAAGLHHGEITDATVLVGTKAPKTSSDTPWHFGTDVSATFGTLGLAAGRADGEAATLDDVAFVRGDYVLFFAPERFDAEGRLRTSSCPEGDIWALGVLLLYMLGRSLPLVTLGPAVCFLFNPREEIASDS